MTPVDVRPLFVALFRGSSDGILLVDGTKRIRLWNPVMERLLGHRATAVSGRSLTEVLPAFEASSQEGNRLTRALAGEPGRGVLTGIEIPGHPALEDIPLRYIPGAGESGPWVLILLEVPALDEEDVRAAARATVAGPPPPPPVPPAPSFPDEPDTPDPMVLDRDAALGYLEGKEELMAEMAEIFLSTWEDLLLSLEMAIRDRKGEEAMGMAQSLKGMAASLGGHRTTWAVSELESTIREERWEEAPRILHRLRPQVLRLARALARYLRPAA